MLRRVRIIRDLWRAFLHAQLNYNIGNSKRLPVALEIDVNYVILYASTVSMVQRITKNSKSGVQRIPKEQKFHAYHVELHQALTDELMQLVTK